MTQLTTSRGAAVLPDGGVRFSVWAPAQRRLAVRVHDEAGARDIPMERDAFGTFEVVVPDAGAGLLYEYVTELGAARPDPASRSQPRGVHGPSCVVDPRAFRWTDGGWRGLEMADLAIYELHVGTFSAEGTFDAVILALAGLRDLGITAIEVMPVAEFPGTRNWGYDGVHPYAPQSSYGGAEGLRRLVDAAHREGLAVLLDVVYNHVGPEGNYLGEYGPYFTDRYRTPWGRALNFDDAGSDEVRRWAVENATHWIEEHHMDGLRLDAVHAIYDASPVHILREIAESVHAAGARSGRRTLAIAESDLNDARLVRPPDVGGYGLDGQWSDDYHHAVHVALTGERSGYYADYSGAREVGKALADRFVYDGRYSPHRGRRHGAPCRDVPADRFVVCLQNHDQVGNRATGDRLTALVAPAQARLAAALLLLSPYVPLLFMGQEYGEPNPFQYFVSHGDESLAEAVREGRRREFASFAWEGEVPDPTAEDTFHRSRIEHARAASSPHRELRALHRDLLWMRRREPALRPGCAEVAVHGGDEEGWIVMELRPVGAGAPPRGHDATGRASMSHLDDASRREATRGEPRALAAIFNLCGEHRLVPLPPGSWRHEWSSEHPAYGGGARADETDARGAAAPAMVPVAPWAAELYSSEAST